MSHSVNKIQARLPGGKATDAVVAFDGGASVVWADSNTAMCLFLGSHSPQSKLLLLHRIYLPNNSRPVGYVDLPGQ